MSFQWIAQQLADGTPVVLARVVAVSGFGGKRSGEVMGITSGETVGALAMGAANAATIEAARQVLREGLTGASIIVPVGDEEAVSAGLACGGAATVMVQAASTLPAAFWHAVNANDAVVLASHTITGASLTVSPQTVEGSIENDDEQIITSARQMLAKGPIERTITIGDAEIHLELVAPQPRLVVLGEAELSKALVRQGELLGWQVDVRSDKGAGADEAIALAATSGPLDGVVVLSHDVAASCAVLAAALNGSCGYVGALGSRHTQGARRAHLEQQLGLPADKLDRVHGPVGLDLGSRTPEETALAIAAEMIAVRSARTARSLSA
jgi:xanthine dehydrogenase accessory factor